MKTALVILVFRVLPLHALSCHFTAKLLFIKLITVYVIIMTTLSLDGCHLHFSVTVSEQCVNTLSHKQWRACIRACIYLKTAVNTVGDSWSRIEQNRLVSWRPKNALSTSCFRWKPVFESNNSIVGFSRNVCLALFFSVAVCWVVRHPQISGIQPRKCSCHYKVL